MNPDEPASSVITNTTKYEQQINLKNEKIKISTDIDHVAACDDLSKEGHILASF